MGFFKEQLSMGGELGDDDFFTALYQQYMPRIFHFFNSKIQNETEAEDLTSNVFIKVLEKRSSFDPDKASFTTWIFTITRNQLIDYYRVRRIDLPLTAELMEECAGDIAAGAGALPEDRELWTQIVSLLSEKEMTVIYSKYYYGQSNRQIARSTGINENTVSTLHRRALKKLRVKIKDFF